MKDFPETEAREAAEKQLPIKDGYLRIDHEAYVLGCRAAWEKAQEDIDRLQKLADSQIAYATRLEAGLKIATNLLQEWYDDDYDGADLLARTGEALAKIRPIT